jgi:F0F1-type ATP synthase gamma subunit
MIGLGVMGRNFLLNTAMQGADKNIDELLEDLNGTFHPLCQSGIDEKLFDVISGFEALNGEEKGCALA